MGTVIDKDRTVAALADVWASLDELLGGLDDEQWLLPSPLPGWDVRDNVAHIIGTEAMLSGRPNPPAVDRDAIDHVRNDIGAMNEAWVEQYRAVDPATVLADFRQITAERLATLRAMSDDDWNAEGFTPAGTDAYGRFMQIRVFDCWLHEQDIRDAAGRPGGDDGDSVQVMLDELTTAMGFVVGKRAGVPAGNSIVFVLTGADGSVVRTITVDVAERAAVVDAPGQNSVTTLTMPVGVMTRLCAGRADYDELGSRVDISGDAGLAEQLLRNCRYTI